jgi:hypothetical protein
MGNLADELQDQYVPILGLFLPPSCVLWDTAQMDDSEFWAHVYGGDRPEADYDEPDVPEQFSFVQPCPICGSTEACGSDEMGRPMIHSIPVDLDG